MKTITIRDIKQENTDGVPLSVVYVIREGDSVLYVGKSKNAITRVESHLGMGQWGWCNTGSVLSQYLRSNNSDDFTVDLYDHMDVKIAANIPEDCRLYSCERDGYVADLERELINKLSPKFNMIGN